MTSNIIKPTGKGWWGGEVAPRLREQWTAHGGLLLRIAVVLAAIVTPLRLLRVFPELLWDFRPGSARDLKYRYLEVHTWFAGLPVYGSVNTADYPPASYAMLWPLIGWLPLSPARWLWAAAILAGLGFLAYVSLRANKAGTPMQWLFMALLPFSVYPTSATIFPGQLIIHCLAPLMAGLLLLRRGRGRWWEDVLAAGLLIAALAKPTVTAPFFWLVLFLPGRLRPIVLVSLGYLALTLFASSFQEASLPALLQAWRGQESQISVEQGNTNLSGWLAAIGLEEAIVPAALLTLLGLGVWTWRHRKTDFWLLVGVLGLATRLWIHHRGYDDLLFLAPMIALLRLARQSPAPDGSDVTAGLLFGLTWMTMLAPVDWLLWVPASTLLMKVWLGALWVTVLLFLLGQVRQEKERSSSRSMGEGLKLFSIFQLIFVICHRLRANLVNTQ